MTELTEISPALREAWFKFKEKYEKDNPGINLSLIVFTAGWNAHKKYDLERFKD